MSSKAARRLGLKPSVRRKRRDGPRRSPAQIDRDERATAIHESGHAVAAAVLGLGLEAVSLGVQTLPDGSPVKGFARIGALDCVKVMARGAEAAIPRMVAIFAGPLAERLLFHARGIRPPDEPPPIPDHEQLYLLASLATCDLPEDSEQSVRAIEDLYREANRRATDLIHRHIDSILAVATALLRRRTLSGAEVAAIVAAKSGDSS